MANKKLTSAKKIKNDEFYTQYSDIQKEIESYLEYNPDTFRNKVIYSNCDDPYESNFFRYFVLNFKRLGLKRLITTSYKPSPVANTQVALFGDDVTLEPAKGRPKVTANKFVINEVGDVDGDGSFTLEDIALQLKANKHNEWCPLEEDGDFRSSECIELLNQSDIVVTNPPFSLFREYVAQLVEHSKRFLIIGNLNAITYKEIFPLIKTNKLWLGPSITSGDREFEIPETVVDMNMFTGEVREGRYYQKVMGVRWYTNLDHGKRHQPLSLMTKDDNLKFNKKLQDKPIYKHYENFDGVEVSYTDAIPSDYMGIMGVPISFLDKYSPDQFTILGLGIANLGLEAGVHPYKPEHRKYRKEVQKRGVVDGDLYLMIDDIVSVPYARVLIKHKKKLA